MFNFRYTFWAIHDECFTGKSKKSCKKALRVNEAETSFLFLADLYLTCMCEYHTFEVNNENIEGNDFLNV